MNIGNRIFSYPVLSEEKPDDYDNATFHVTPACKQELNTLDMTFDFELKCPAIWQLINSGKAVFAIHLECPHTSYRKYLPSRNPHIPYQVKTSEVNGEIQRVAFVILTKRVQNFTSPDFGEDFQGMTFSLMPGTILAYQNLSSIDVTKNFEELKDASSIFYIYKKRSNQSIPMEVQLEDDKIGIGLSEQEFQIYQRFGSRPELNHIFHSMVILPVLVYVFGELKKDTYEMYSSHMWYKVLNRLYEKKGLNFDDEVTDKSAILLAQETMDLPITQAFEQIPQVFEMGDE